MSLKEQVEGHPVFFVGGVVVAAFAAGWAAHSAIVPSGPATALACNVEGLPDLSNAHSQRLAALEAGLVKLEASASDDSKIPVDQDTYKAAADRVRKDIAAEQNAFGNQLLVLRKACS